MNSRRFNWRLWSGLVLAIVTFVSYLFFVQFPITRDVPWVNYILFVIATVLLISGVRRAERKVVPSIVAALGIGIFAFFIFGVTVLTKMLPPSHGAPKVGQKAPDFALRDTHGHVVTLSNLLASSPRGVLLVFYRGYW